MRAVVRAVLFGIAGVALVMADAGHGLAGTPVNVPEIDGSTVATGLGAVSAGVLILRSYFGKR
jgi:hypothetical protein